MAEARAMVELPVQAVVCPVHGEPFRAQWPLGYPGFSIEIFKAAAATDELFEAAGGDAHRLNAAIAEFGPCCRLVTAEDRLRAYKAACDMSPSFKQHGICVICRKWKPGTAYSATQPAGAVLTRHVCFECVARRECA